MMIKPQITPVEIELIQKLISSNPTWSRTRLSLELCRIWDWRHPDGHPKEISCRDLLRQLEAKGLIDLPPCRQKPVFKPGYKSHIQLMLHDTTEIPGDIRDILPIHLEIVQEGSFQGQEFKSLIDQYHCLQQAGATPRLLTVRFCGLDLCSPGPIYWLECYQPSESFDLHDQ
jgi:hypothetical protein